jgi:hypothetical protein
VQAGGVPVQAASHWQPESVQVVAAVSVLHSKAVPMHFLPTHAQPATLSQLVASVVALHFVTVPEQLSVAWQPLAFPHCFAVSAAQEVAVPMHTGAPPAPAVVPPATPPEPAWLTAPPVPPLALGAPASPATLESPPLAVSSAPEAPALCELLPLLLSPAAPAVSAPEAPAPEPLLSALVPPQLTLTETAQGTNQSQENRFMRSV